MNLWSRFKIWTGWEQHPEVTRACNTGSGLDDSVLYNIKCEDCKVLIAANGLFRTSLFHTKNVFHRGSGENWERPKGWRENNAPEYRCMDCAEKLGYYKKISDCVDAPVMGVFHHEIGPINMKPSCEKPKAGERCVLRFDGDEVVCGR